MSCQQMAKITADESSFVMGSANLVLYFQSLWLSSTLCNFFLQLNAEPCKFCAIMNSLLYSNLELSMHEWRADNDECYQLTHSNQCYKCIVLIATRLLHTEWNERGLNQGSWKFMFYAIYNWHGHILYILGCCYCERNLISRLCFCHCKMCWIPVLPIHKNTCTSIYIEEAV